MLGRLTTGPCGLALLLALAPAMPAAGGVTEFCLSGELDLAARFQGLDTPAGELYPTTWCVISDDNSKRVRFAATGNSNPDMDGSWTVAYQPPETVRIINRDNPPDILFSPVEPFTGAARVRRLDPRRLLEEIREGNKPPDNINVEIANGRVTTVRTVADFPLRGRVPVEWHWDWSDPERPQAQLIVDDLVFFTATGGWRKLSDAEAAAAFAVTPGADPIEIPGDRWPSKVDMQLLNLTDGVFLVRGVRTGFQHIVVETGTGLVVGDAPAGWLEIHHVPPSDLVPGLGISGLSEQFVDFLAQEFPDRPIEAVAITHLHDDHAGGARAFVAAGAQVYAPRGVAAFLADALNRQSMPRDRLAELGSDVQIKPVGQVVEIGDSPHRVQLIPLPRGPHVDHMLGLLAVDAGYFFVSDVHVPQDEGEAPAPHRTETECWFADWAVSALPPGTRVVNSHSAVVTPLSRLAAYLRSDAC